MALLATLYHFQTPHYVATSTVLLEPSRELGSYAQDGDTANLYSQLVAIQANAVRSPTVLGQVVDRMGLAENPDWNGARNAQTDLAALAPQIAPLLRSIGIQPPRRPTAVRKFAIGKLRHAVTPRRKGASLLMEITVTARDAKSAAFVANVLTDTYLESQLSAIYSPNPPKAAPGVPRLSGLRQVSEASIPVRPSTHRGRAAALGLIITALVAFGLGWLRDVLDTGVGGFKDAERKTGRNALASVPLLRASALKNLPEGLQNAPGYAAEKPMSGYAESFRNLRTALLYAGQGEPPKVICMTSAQKTEGKTTLALSLARVSAMAGQRTLLVDCDLRSRALNEMLNVKPQYGFLDVVTGGANWRETVLRDRASSLDILPGVKSYYRPRDIFSSAAMSRLMDEWKQEYDFIVLDAPAVFSAPDTALISRLADQTVVAVHWTKTPAGMVRSAVHALETTGSNVVGLLLNFVDPRAHGRLTVADTAYQAKFATRYYAS